jgi:hypothetical protein
VTEVAVVAAVGSSYGTDGPLATLAALVLAPVAVVATFRAGRLLAGDAFGFAAAAVYVALPALGTVYMLASYRSTFAHQAIPDLVGLRATPFFAAGIGLALCVAAPRAAFATLGLVLAAGALIRYGTGAFGDLRNGLHETAWSITMLEWFVLAGVFGAARRSPLISIGLAGWLTAAVLHAADRGYDGAAFWQSLAPAAPAIALLLTSLVLLVPRLRPAAARAH